MAATNGDTTGRFCPAGELGRSVPLHLPTHTGGSRKRRTAFLHERRCPPATQTAMRLTKYAYAGKVWVKKRVRGEVRIKKRVRGSLPFTRLALEALFEIRVRGVGGHEIRARAYTNDPVWKCQGESFLEEITISGQWKTTDGRWSSFRRAITPPTPGRIVHSIGYSYRPASFR